MTRRPVFVWGVPLSRQSERDAKYYRFSNTVILFRSYTKLCVTRLKVGDSHVFAIRTRPTYCTAHAVLGGYCKNVNVMMYVLLGRRSKWLKVRLYWKFKSKLSVLVVRSTSGKSIAYKLLLSKPRTHHHRRHNSPKLDPILSLLQLLSMFTTSVPKTFCSVILPSMTWSPERPPSRKYNI